MPELKNGYRASAFSLRRRSVIQIFPVSSPMAKISLSPTAQMLTFPVPGTWSNERWGRVGAKPGTSVPAAVSCLRRDCEPKCTGSHHDRKEVDPIAVRRPLRLAVQSLTIRDRHPSRPRGPGSNESRLPAWPGHTEEELASRPDCFSIPIAQKRRLQLAENKARVREFLESTWPAWRGHTEEERASRPDCFCIPIAQKRRLQLAENKARVREFLKSTWPAWPGHTEEELASRPDCFRYELRRSDGCKLLKTKLEFASSSKAEGPPGRAIRKRNSLPGAMAFDTNCAGATVASC